MLLVIFMHKTSPFLQAAVLQELCLRDVTYETKLLPETNPVQERKSALVYVSCSPTINARRNAVNYKSCTCTPLAVYYPYPFIRDLTPEFSIIQIIPFAYFSEHLT